MGSYWPPGWQSRILALIAAYEACFKNWRPYLSAGGGSADSFTLGIAHSEGDVAVLDCLFERRPPFNPSEVVEEIAALLKSYRLTSCIGDRYAAGWVVEAFQKVGISYSHSERDRSAIYSDVLPLFTSGRVRLLDSTRLVSQFSSLERRTSIGGRDRIDHGRDGHDDACNACSRGFSPGQHHVPISLDT